MSTWIDDDSIREAMGGDDLSALEESGMLYCITPDKLCCLFVREYDSWYIEGEGWRCGNYPPESNDSGRLKIVFLKRQSGKDIGFGFNAFIPKSINISNIELEDDDRFVVTIDSKKRYVSCNRALGLHIDLMTGNAQPEAEIENKFEMIWDE